MPAPKLLDQVRERIRVKHYSLWTEDAYLHWIRRFIFFFARYFDSSHACTSEVRR